VNRDLVFGGACLALAVGYYVMAAAIPESALADTVGPQGLPKTYALLLAGLSLVLIVRSSAARRDQGSGIRDHKPISSIPDPRSPIPRIAGMLLIGALYLAFVPWLGYVLSLTGLIAATIYYQGGGMNARVALVSLSGAIFFWVLFVTILGISHPPGIWPSLF
jgi:putative tricarboxylic transport membrane protein